MMKKKIIILNRSLTFFATFTAMVFMALTLAGYSFDTAAVCSGDTWTSASNSFMIKKGKGLFFSKNIGTNGMSCATCHVYKAGTYVYIHGRTVMIKRLDNDNIDKNFPAFDKRMRSRISLQKKINNCDKFALKGKGLSKGEIASIIAYLKSLK